MVVSLVIIVISFFIPECWRHFVPTHETKLLTHTTNQPCEFRQDFDQSKRKPKFDIFINNRALTKISEIEIASDMGPYKIRQANFGIRTTNTELDVNNEPDVKISVRNTGNLPADKLLVKIVLSFPWGGKAKVGERWQKEMRVKPTTNRFSANETTESYYTESAHVVPPGDYFGCDSIFLKGSMIYLLTVEVSASQADNQCFDLTLLFFPKREDGLSTSLEVSEKAAQDQTWLNPYLL